MAIIGLAMVLRGTFSRWYNPKVVAYKTRIYGFKDDITLYFAHHEKLCLIDDEIAFMGGLDLCFGRV